MELGFAHDFGPVRIGDDEARIKRASVVSQNPQDFRPEDRVDGPSPGIDAPQRGRR
jgi:hypothetical protein